MYTPEVKSTQRRKIMIRKTAIATLILLGALLSSPTTYAQDSMAGDSDASLYVRLGGLMPISVVVSDFIAALVPDPLMNENPAIATARKQVPAAYLNYHVTAFVCMATGGPCGYTGRGMPESHAHLNISGREWDRMMTIFVDVLANHKVPERETRELVALLGTTRDAIVTAD
jgi:hemoglobin